MVVRGLVDALYIVGDVLQTTCGTIGMSQEHRYIECPIVRFHVTMFWHWATILRTTCTRVWWTSTLYNQLYIYIYTVYVNFIVISISRFEMLLVVYGCGLLSGERVLQHVPLIPMLSLLWEFLEHV